MADSTISFASADGLLLLHRLTGRLLLHELTGLFLLHGLTGCSSPVSVCVAVLAGHLLRLDADAVRTRHGAGPLDPYCPATFGLELTRVGKEQVFGNIVERRSKSKSRVAQRHLLRTRHPNQIEPFSSLIYPRESRTGVPVPS